MSLFAFCRRALLAPLLLASFACQDANEPPDNGGQTTQPNFLRLSASAPPPAQTTVSFWAKKGEDRDVDIDFAAEPGALDTVEFLEFKVRAGSLAFRPDGSPFALGDSILITITVEDAENMIFRFQPSGLRFSASEPARLDLYYSLADPDFDEDGTVDSDDAIIEATKLAIWKQEVVGGPWVKLGVIRDIEIDEIEANITSFTGFAIAY